MSQGGRKRNASKRPRVANSNGLSAKKKRLWGKQYAFGIKSERKRWSKRDSVSQITPLQLFVILTSIQNAIFLFLVRITEPKMPRFSSSSFLRRPKTNVSHPCTLDGDLKWVFSTRCNVYTDRNCSFSGPCLFYRDQKPPFHLPVIRTST